MVHAGHRLYGDAKRLGVTAQPDGKTPIPWYYVSAEARCMSILRSRLRPGRDRPSCPFATRDSGVRRDAPDENVLLPRGGEGGGAKDCLAVEFPCSVDITAPDNPLTPLNSNVGSYAGLGAYQVFSGTSGAGPHVAGVAALVKQLKPSLDGVGVRKAIQQGALVDSQVGSVPSKTWGHGKLRAYRTLFGKDPASNTAPTVTLSGGPAYVGGPVTLKAVVKDAEQGQSELQIRWDEGYDGSWDSSYGPIKPLVRTYDKEGTVRIKVEVKDSGGLTGAAAVLFKVLPGSQKPDGGGDGASTDGGTPPDEEASGCGCHAAQRAGSVAGVGLLLGLLLGLFCLARVRRRGRAP